MRLCILSLLAPLVGCALVPAEGTWDLRNQVELQDTCGAGDPEDGDFVLTNSLSEDDAFTVSIADDNSGETFALACLFDGGKDFSCTSENREYVALGDITLVYELDAIGSFSNAETLAAQIDFTFTCEGANCGTASTITGIDPCTQSVDADAFYRAGQ